MEEGSCIRDPPGMVRELYSTSALVPSSITLLPAVKLFSHVGKVLGLDGRVAWLNATRKRTLWGPTTASASWKDRKSTPRRATDSPQRRARSFPEDPDALQFWACYRARTSPKWRAEGAESHLAFESATRARSVANNVGVASVNTVNHKVASGRAVVAKGDLLKARGDCCNTPDRPFPGGSSGGALGIGHKNFFPLCRFSLVDPDY